jgi:hypothetical protein
MAIIDHWAHFPLSRPSSCHIRCVAVLRYDTTTSTNQKIWNMVRIQVLDEGPKVLTTRRQGKSKEVRGKRNSPAPSLAFPPQLNESIRSDVDLHASEKELESTDNDTTSESGSSDDESHDVNYGVDDDVDRFHQKEDDNIAIDETDHIHQMQDKANKQNIRPPSSRTGEACTFDLRNLTAFNSHQNDVSRLYTSKSNINAATNNNCRVTIARAGMLAIPNDDYLLEKATDGCSQIIDAIWQLPVEKKDMGSVAFLPSYDSIKIPRALVCTRSFCELRFVKVYTGKIAFLSFSELAD